MWLSLNNCERLVPNLTNMCNFHPLEVVGRGSDTQLQVGENLNKVTQRAEACICLRRTVIRGAPLDFQGGGAGVFVAGKLFISTGLGGVLKISHFVTCLYGTVLEVNYLFHAESARNYLFQKYSCPPPLGI